MVAAHRSTSLPPLTVKAIEAAKPAAAAYELGDSAAKGLRLRVAPTGARVFRWYVAGRVVTIGRWSKAPQPGHVTLGEARTWLERLKAAHAADQLAAVEADLVAQVRPARRDRGEDPEDGAGALLRDVAADFLKLMERKRKNPEEVRRTIEKEIVPALGDRPIASVTSRDVRRVVEAVVARGALTQAGKVLDHAKALFRFAAGRDQIQPAANPAFPLDADALGIVKNVSQRYLSSEEIPLFLAAIGLSRLTLTVRSGLKVLLQTGVRSCELLRARWENVDLDAATWTVPVSDQKLTKKQEQTARPWVVPLSPAVVDLFKQLKVLAQASPWVMASPVDEREPLSEKALVAGMRSLFEAPEGKEALLRFAGERPTPHDLRRSVRTHLGETLGVRWDVAERCLNHSVGTITKTYDVGDYLAERRAALEKWSAYLDRLLSPAAAPVAFLPAKARRA